MSKVLSADHKLDQQTNILNNRSTDKKFDQQLHQQIKARSIDKKDVSTNQKSDQQIKSYINDQNLHQQRKYRLTD